MTSTFDLAHTAAGEQLRKHLAALLADWLPQQRWFGGKGTGIESVAIDSFEQLFDRDPAHSATEPVLWHLLVTARLRAAVDEVPETQTYQVFLGVRPSLPHWLVHAAIGGPGEVVSELGGVCYDALHDAEITVRLLDGLVERQSFGLLRFDRPTGPEPVRGLRPRMLTTEQSNTSLVFGDRYIAKVLRRPTAGLNPDLELVTALAEVGSPHIARPVGWLERGAPGDSDPMTLVVVQEFLKSATDGWSLALASVRDLYAAGPQLPAARAGADFAPEAFRLGEATARVHQDLASALPTGRLSEQESAALAAGMVERLEATAQRVPALRPHVDALRSALVDAARLHSEQQVQRVHGDYHLGQVVRTIHGWILLDFEGEPTRPLSQRRAMTSALKDVAGMLRSFDYAAHHQLTIAVPEGAESSTMPARAAEWAERNRDAFCAGYADAAEADPREQGVLLRAFEIDKAVYEVAYEAANRPSWLQIPLAACARLAG
jgi:maltokinase